MHQQNDAGIALALQLADLAHAHRIAHALA
jgi:hypothetical protein